MGLNITHIIKCFFYIISYYLEYLKGQKIQVNVAATLQKENLNSFKGIIYLCSKYNLTLRIGACYNDGKSNTTPQWQTYYNTIVRPFAKQWPELKAYAEKLNTTVYCFLDKELVDDSIKDPMSIKSSFLIFPILQSGFNNNEYGNILPSLSMTM